MLIFERLFKENQLEVVAPSQFIMNYGNPDFRLMQVHTLSSLPDLTGSNPAYNRYQSGNLRVGFFGLSIGLQRLGMPG
jgi:hypothetical protein